MPFSSRAWLEFATLLEDLPKRTWPASLEQVAQWYEAQMDRIFDEAAMRVADIPQLARIAATYPSQVGPANTTMGI